MSQVLADKEVAMQELTKTLDELKGLHAKALGRAAPTLTPQSFFPFPPGVDPVEHARLEADHLTKLMERYEFAPVPEAWAPPADVLVSDDAFIARIEIPGVSREDVKVHVIGRECIVRGERKPPQGAERMRPLSLERPWGKFERRFVLPLGSRVDAVTAPCVDGVLELKIPVDNTARSKSR